MADAAARRAQNVVLLAERTLIMGRERLFAIRLRTGARERLGAVLPDASVVEANGGMYVIARRVDPEGRYFGLVVPRKDKPDLDLSIPHDCIEYFLRIEDAAKLGFAPE